MAKIAVKAAQYDADGIDIYFLNNKRSYQNLKVGNFSPVLFNVPH